MPGIDELELRAFKLAHANGPLRQSTMDAICTALAALLQQASAYIFHLEANSPKHAHAAIKKAATLALVLVKHPVR